MLPAISPGVAVAVCVVLAVIGGLILTAIAGFLVFLLVRKIKSTKAAKTAAPAANTGILPGLFGVASKISGSPLVQEMEKEVVAAVEASAKTAIKNAAGQMIPGLQPFIAGFPIAAPTPTPGQLFADAQKALAQGQTLLGK